MPLHLLGKKSWNVYNEDNIERVRRDEAEAQLQEAAEEKRLQEIDAEKRLAQLRGIGYDRSEEQESQNLIKSRPYTNESRKKRRLAGEDDTDRDLRLARQESTNVKEISVARAKSRDAPLFDQAGHIDLIPQQHKKPKLKNAEAEAEAAARRKGYEDQYTMRFSNASGMHDNSSKPWYSSLGGPNPEMNSVSKDVWGNEDPGRKDREKQRMDANDPLAAMKRGVKQLRQAEAHRNEWREQRERDLNEVEDMARRERKHRKRRLSDEGSLDGFDLDQGYKKDDVDRSRHEKNDRHHRRHHHHKHRHRHRDRERSRSPRRHRERRDKDISDFME